GGDARVVGDLVNRGFFLAFGDGSSVGLSGDEILHIVFMDGVVVGDLHGTKLEESKVFAVLAHARLTKEDRTFGAELDTDGEHEKQRSENEQGCATTNDIHYTLDDQRSFLFFFFLEKIWVQGSGYGASGTIAGPAIGKGIEGYLQLVYLIAPERFVQAVGDFGFNGLNGGGSLRFPEFGEDGAHDGVSFEPAGQIGFANFGSDHTGNFFDEWLVHTARGGSFAIDQHEQQVLARALGALAF